MTLSNHGILAPPFAGVTLRSVDTHVKRSGPHRAAHHLVLYFFKANLMMTLEERMLSLVDGSIVLVPEGSQYAFAYGSACEYYCLSFDPPEGSEALIHTMWHKRQNSIHLADEGQKACLRQQMESLYLHLQHPDRLPEPLMQPYTNACVTKLLLDVYALQAQMEQKPSQSAHQHLANELVSYLDEHFLSSITLDQLEKTFFLSRFHLCRLFRKHTQMTIFAYIRWKKAQVAAELLAQTDREIAAIGFESGFGNLQSFYTAFKQVFAKTPLQYRKAKGTGG